MCFSIVLFAKLLKNINKKTMLTKMSALSTSIEKKNYLFTINLLELLVVPLLKFTI